MPLAAQILEGAATNKKNKKLGLIVLAAIFAIAALRAGPPARAQSARGAVPFDAAARLANPRPDQDDDASDEAGDPSGDATPEPEPQPPTT